MALKTPDMESCDVKQRCLSGPNKGLAYSVSSPCNASEIFDPVACDCLQPHGCFSVTAVVVSKSVNTTVNSLWTKPADYFELNGDAVTYHFVMEQALACDANISRLPCDCLDSFCDEVQEASLTLGAAFCQNNPTYDGALLAANFTLQKRVNGVFSQRLHTESTGFDANAACDGVNPATYQVTLELLYPGACV